MHLAETIILSDGCAPAEAFPGEQLASLASDILRYHADEALQYGDLEGFMPLRELVAGWLAADGVEATADEVIIVTGAKQNLDMATRAFCAAGDSIIVGAPTYMNGIRIFQGTGVELETVPHDESGIGVDAIETLLSERHRAHGRLPKLIYDVPDFHNPTGTVLPEERREKLVYLASHYGILILEDNPYRWTRVDGDAVPPIGHFGVDDVVISTGTFAKILGPGLRLGWVHAKRSILDRILRYKVDGSTSPLCQMLAYEFYKSPGSLDRHLSKVRGALRMKRDAMLQALQENLSDFATWSHPAGGYYVWVTLRDGIDTDELTMRALKAGVAVYPGSTFFATSSPPKRHIRLAYSFESADRIREGVQRIGQLLGSAPTQSKLNTWVDAVAR